MDMHTITSGPSPHTSCCARSSIWASTHGCSAKMAAHQAVDIQTRAHEAAISSTAGSPSSSPPQRLGMSMRGTPSSMNSATVSLGSLPSRSASAALAANRSAGAASIPAGYLIIRGTMASEDIIREKLAIGSRILTMKGLIGLYGHVSAYDPDT